MPRLVRIALTFFVSATVLVLLVSQRIGRLQRDLEVTTGEVAEELAKQEGGMIMLGLLLSGALAVAGFVLILIAMFRGRRQTRGNEGRGPAR